MFAPHTQHPGVSCYRWVRIVLSQNPTTPKKHKLNLLNYHGCMYTHAKMPKKIQTVLPYCIVHCTWFYISPFVLPSTIWLHGQEIGSIRGIALNCTAPDSSQTLGQLIPTNQGVLHSLYSYDHMCMCNKKKEWTSRLTLGIRDFHIPGLWVWIIPQLTHSPYFFHFSTGTDMTNFSEGRDGLLLFDTFWFWWDLWCSDLLLNWDALTSPCWDWEFIGLEIGGGSSSVKRVRWALSVCFSTPSSLKMV